MAKYPVDITTYFLKGESTSYSLLLDQAKPNQTYKQTKIPNIPTITFRKVCLLLFISSEILYLNILSTHYEVIKHKNIDNGNSKTGLQMIGTMRLFKEKNKEKFFLILLSLYCTVTDFPED